MRRTPFHPLTRRRPDGFGPVITPTITPYVRLRPMTSTGRWLLAVAAAFFCALTLVLWSPDAHADDSEARPAASPYFQVKSGDPTLDALPLKSTRVDVRVAGVIADVTVTQRYRNEGQRPIEARYVFPGSTRAAVHAMTVRLGERLITAEIREKQRARIEFQQAKREGKTAALLEQDRPNVFSMNVANILPGDDIAVELKYTELVVPTEGRYEFVFPTVVGPRYHAPGALQPMPAVPYTAPDDQPTKSAAARPTFDMNVRFASPLAVHGLHSPSHAIEVTHAGQTDAALELGDDAAPRANRDFILHYRLGGERTATGLTLWEGAGENFFMAIVEPPKAIATVQINPREYVFVVDISGSMHGYPLNTAKTLLRNLIGQLRPSDTFNVLLFSGSADMLNATPVPATRANVDRALQVIDRQRGGGSTEIVPALKRIAALPKPNDVSRTVVVVTDGYVMVEQEVFALVRKNLGQSNVFAFGIGHAVNRHLIEGIARAGQGEAFVVTKPEQAAEQAERLRHMIDSPVLTNVRARFEGLDVYDLATESLDNLPDVLGGRPVVIVGKWRGDAASLGSAKLVVQGDGASGTFEDVVLARAPDAHASALKHLWARQAIAQRMDQEALEGGQAQRAAILSLGLKYHLLTPYTSFLAVDQVVRTAVEATPVTQPVALPQGVGHLAVGQAPSAAPTSALSLGAEVPSTPEPTAWLAMLVVLVIVVSTLVHQRRRRPPGDRTGAPLTRNAGASA